jgi:Holliday junction DNA helicase RuvA
MIEQISGNILKKSPTFCVVECSGIGIGLHISLNTYKTLGNEKESINLLTYLHVREDALQLFGFSEDVERETFRKLINVSGVGPRLAMTILSGLSVIEFTTAVVNDNYELLTKIPGVGKKTAQRVTLELKEKLELFPEAAEKDIAVISMDKQKYSEAISALITLGYKRLEAQKSIAKVTRKHGDDIPLEELIKFALKEV